MVSIEHLTDAGKQGNRLSDKMGRRDFIFYDLYKLKDSKEDVQSLQNEGYRFDVYDP
jgi:hypothetical protein